MVRGRSRPQNNYFAEVAELVIRARLKISWSSLHVGSTPTFGTEICFRKKEKI